MPGIHSIANFTFKCKTCNSVAFHRVVLMIKEKIPQEGGIAAWTNYSINTLL